MRRGEIRRYTFALPDKRRPVLFLSRDSVLPSLNEVIVVFERTGEPRSFVSSAIN